MNNKFKDLKTTMTIIDERADQAFEKQESKNKELDSRINFNKEEMEKNLEMTKETVSKKMDWIRDKVDEKLDNIG
jgi:parvulin-like peptidyl-prolyl isomerase